MIYAICLHLLGHLYGTYVERISLKAPGNYSASIWNNKILILFLENQQISFRWFWDFWTCLDPPKQIVFISGDTRIPNTNSEKNLEPFEHILFHKSQFLELPRTPNLEKTRADNWWRSTYKIFKSMDMRSISIKNMKWKICHTYMWQTSFEHIKDFWDLFILK